MSYNYPIITSYKLVSTILVLLPNPKVVTAIKGVVTSAPDGIILTYYSSLV
jgi:hypothetical protein